MQQFSNPFQITNPVEPGDVIDRDVECDRLIALAEEGNNARLVAPRRYGKTSLVRRVQAEIALRDWTTVYVDLLGIVNLDDVASRVERAYEVALKGPIARWFTALRRSLRPTVTAGGGPLPAAATVDLGGRAREALADRLALPVKVHQKTGRRVHVVFDEFQELDGVDGQVDAVVRSEIQHHGHAASYIFAGSQLRMMEMLFTDRKRAFYGQTQPVHLRPLAAADLGEYIEGRFELTGKTVSSPALGRLLDFVHGHPQRAMAAAHALWRATEAEAGLLEWEAARSDLMEDVGEELRSVWEHLSVRERQTLVTVAMGQPPYRRSGDRSRGGAIASILKRLEGEGVLVRQDGRWLVVDPLLAHWAREGRP